MSDNTNKYILVKLDAFINSYNIEQALADSNINIGMTLGMNAEHQVDYNDTNHRYWYEWSKKIHEIKDELYNHRNDLILSGPGPLSLFTMFGLRLTKHTIHRVRYFMNYDNRRQKWIKLDLRPETNDVNYPGIIEMISPVNPRSTGKIVLFITLDTSFVMTPKNIEEIVNLNQQQGHDTLGIFTIRYAKEGCRLELETKHIPSIEACFKNMLHSLKTRYENNDGLVIITTGPSVLSLLIGSWINVHIHGQPLFIERVGQEYKSAFLHN